MLSVVTFSGSGEDAELAWIAGATSVSSDFRECSAITVSAVDSCGSDVVCCTSTSCFDSGDATATSTAAMTTKWSRLGDFESRCQ